MFEGKLNQMRHLPRSITFHLFPAHDEKEKIEKIQQERKQLSQKQVELEKTHQQRVKSHEEQKTPYQHLFGQPPLHQTHCLCSAQKQKSIQ